MATTTLSAMTLRVYQALLDQLNQTINPYGPLVDANNLPTLPPLTAEASDSQVTFGAPTVVAKASYNTSISITGSGVYENVATVYYNRPDITNKVYRVNVAAISSWADLANRINVEHGTYFTENDFRDAFTGVPGGASTFALSATALAYTGTLSIDGHYDNTGLDLAISNTQLSGFSSIALPLARVIGVTKLSGFTA